MCKNSVQVHKKHKKVQKKIDTEERRMLCSFQKKKCKRIP